MSHLPHIIHDLALILIVAGGITLLFKWLKQPLVLGYIVAGILAGPYIDLFPTVVDITNIQVWADIGVIFLLFALGLEFSFKKMTNVGGSASITAITEVVCMLLVGFCVGSLLGWNAMDSIFLGGMLSMSSTTIIIKAFDDLNLRNQKFTNVVFGTLVVEDLVAILLMVLLSTVAVSQHFAGEEMLGALLKLGFFLILWFLIGIYLLPTFFRKARKIMNDETLLVISLGLCIGMVVVATKTGFSAALGAFIMGSILAETVEGKRIEHLIKGLKDFFGAVFFVSVGMLVNPTVLWDYAFPILLITVVTIVGKSFFSCAGVLLSGQPLKVSIQSGFSLAQIGEFAFIIATLGASLGVMSDFIYPIIVAVSVITTFTTPYFIRFAEPFYNWLYPRLPFKFKRMLEKLSEGTSTVNYESDWKLLLKRTISRDVIYSVIIVAIIMAVFRFLYPLISGRLPESIVSIAVAVIALIGIAPFVRILLFNKGNSDLFLKLWNKNRFNRGGLIVLLLLQASLGLFFISLVLIRAFNFTGILGYVISAAILVFIILSRHLLHYYSSMEDRFLANLNQKEDEEKESLQSPLQASFEKHLIDRDIHLSDIIVSPDSKYIGMTLQEADFRKDYGVNVVKISRGSKEITIPNADEYIYPYDRLVVLGTDEQITLFTGDIEIQNDDTCIKRNEIALQSFLIEPESRLCGVSIKESGIKRETGNLVVGIERMGTSSMNPHIEMEFEPGDRVWVVGEKDRLFPFLEATNDLG
jgi:CPA2 family monovalent cation:H+ antiporter-2